MIRPPRPVVLATAAFGLLTAFWSVLTPLTEAPDEPAHFGLVDHIADTGEYPPYDGLQHTVGMLQLCVDYATSVNWCRTAEERAERATERARPADAAPPKHDRPRADDPAFRQPLPDRANQMPQHPPLYYLAMAGALRIERSLVPGDLSVDTELAYLRLLNVLVVLPLPWLAWLAARRLRLAPSTGVVAALVPLAVPQLSHIGGTVNNDNLFVVLVAALMVLLAGVARGDRTRRTAALVGVATGLALLTKGFGVVLPPVVALAYVLGAVTSGRSVPDPTGIDVSGPRGMSRLAWLRPSAWLAVGALAVAIALSGWWYAANLLATGQIMPSTDDHRLGPGGRPPGFHPRFGEYAGSAVTRLVEGFWGAFGWRRVELPTVISVTATVLCLAAVLVAFRRPTRRAELALLLAPTALLALFVLVRSASIYRDSGQLAFQQGRYLFAGLSSAGVVLAVGISRALGRWAVRITVTLAVVLQGLAVVTCLSGWWGADDVPLGSLAAVVAWSGWPDPVVVALLALAPAAVVALLHTTWRSAPAEDPRPEPCLPASSGSPGSPTSLPGPTPTTALSEAVSQSP